jgi:predicted amidohydrolase YtcJ
LIDFVLDNARVVTCDEAGTPAEAVAVSAGRIVAVGRSDTVRSAAGPGFRVVDLDGSVVLPGFVDTHPHLLHFGTLAEPLVDLFDAISHNDIAERIATRADQVPPGEWIMTTPVGEPWYFIRRSYRDLAEGELPDRSVLDHAAPDHPVLIQAWAPVVPNVCAMNTFALRELGITRASPDRIENVWIEKDASGEPTGRLHGSVTNYYSDSDFWNDVMRGLPTLQLEACIPGTERAMRKANEMGVTTIYEAHLMTFSLIEIYRWLRSEGRLSLRVLCCPEAEVVGVPWSDPLQPATYLDCLERARDVVDRSDDLFRIDGVSVSPYGPCWPGFAFMRDSYLSPYGSPTIGRMAVSPEKIEQAIRFCHDNDVRLNIVSSGLAELDSHLEQLEALGQVPLEAQGRSWLLQHFYFAQPDLVRRFAALGFDITTTMSFSWGKGELIRERFGEDLLCDFIPLARLLDAGFHVGAGTDWGPKNVFEQIALAVNPRYGGSGKRAVTPGISRRQAIDMWTREAAHVLRWEGIGAIQSGNHADLVIVDRDPLTCPIEDLAKTRVLATILGGEPVAGAEIPGDLVVTSTSRGASAPPKLSSALLQQHAGVART